MEEIARMLGGLEITARARSHAVEMLERAAMAQERELDGLLAGLVGLLGPALIIVMGVFVMGIVFAMLLPIFEMNTLIR